MSSRTIMVMQEITDESERNYPNHVYHLVKGSGQCIGYEKASDPGVFIRFRKPMVGFSRSYRKFKELRRYQEEV